MLPDRALLKGWETEELGAGGQGHISGHEGVLMGGGGRQAGRQAGKPGVHRPRFTMKPFSLQ